MNREMLAMTRIKGITRTGWRPARILASAALLLAAVAAAHAASGGGGGTGSGDLDVLNMAMGLLGGLALFLFGMEQMSDALKALAAERLKDILARLTTNRYMGALTGAIVTAVIQSSSVTTVLTVGFITAGILSVSQAIGIIFGANIGTTLTAQIVAFKVTKLALVMIAAGFGMLFISKKEKVRHYGAMTMGLGLVFFGMSMMSDAMKPLRTYEPFLDLMTRMENPILGILVAALFTGLVQSSSATTGVVIAMAGQGLITLPAGIALAFGANIGTCVTALLASLGKPRAAVRASLAHVLFNVMGVVLWVWFIDQLAAMVVYISPVSEGLTGVAKLADESPRQIANAHSIFNIVNTLVFLPFGGQFARLVERLAPDRDEERTVYTGAASEWTSIHLDTALLEVPSMALEQTRGEIGRTGKLVRDMVEGIMPAFTNNDAALTDRLVDQSVEVETIGEQIEEFLIQVSRLNLNQDQSEFASQMQDVNAHLVEVATLVKKDILPLLQRKQEDKAALSEEIGQALQGYSGSVQSVLATALEALQENDTELAREVVRAKPRLVEQLVAYRALHHERRQDPMEEAVLTSAYDLDLIDYLRRIFTASEGMAFTMLSGYLDRRGGRRPQRPEAA